MGAPPTGFPTVTVQVAFTSNPTSVSPVWVDITDFVIGFTSSRGRSDELQHYNAGTLNLTLDNRLGNFDPTNTTGPYYPNVLPMKPVRVTALWNSVTYPVFQGFMDGWPQSWPTDRIQVSATDAFKLLGLAYYRNDTEPQETIATRVSAIATAAGVQVAYNGSSTVVVAEAIQSYALSYLQSLEDTEAGSVFMDESGQLRFEERHFRTNNKLTVQATFGDNDSSELPFETLDPIFDDTQIINDASVNASKAKFPPTTPAEYTDATSVTAYGVRSVSKDLLFADGNEASDMAWWLVQRFKTPTLRFSNMTFLPFLQQTTLWPQALGRVIGDLIECKQRPPSGNLIDQQVHIDAISHSWDSETFDWVTAWGLSPKASTLTQWKLDDATFGLWDTTTVLSY